MEITHPRPCLAYSFSCGNSGIAFTRSGSQLYLLRWESLLQQQMHLASNAMLFIPIPIWFSFCFLSSAIFIRNECPLLVTLEGELKKVNY